MPLSHDEFTRFKTYQPRGWKFSRLSASAESLEKQLTVTNKLKLYQLPLRIVFARVKGRRYLRQLLFLYFLVFFVGGTVYVGTPRPNPAISIFLLLMAIFGSLSLIAFLYSRNQISNSKTEIVLTRESLTLDPAGEFIWTNITAIRCLPYANGSGVVLLLLNNGTIVEHNIRSVNEDCT